MRVVSRACLSALLAPHTHTHTHTYTRTHTHIRTNALSLCVFVFVSEHCVRLRVLAFWNGCVTSGESRVPARRTHRGSSQPETKRERERQRERERERERER